MMKSEDRIKAQNVSIRTPYTNLHIYYFEGHLAVDDTALGNDFIGNWQEDEFSFLFFSTPAKEIIDRVLRIQPQLNLLDKFTIAYEDWLGEKPAPIETNRLFITPPWLKVDRPEGKIPIVLDPGVVFGTGTHPTTSDCLRALELAFSEKQFNTVLDLGTGTGLLAIAAALLGGRKVLAADISYLAARTADHNVRLNNLDDRILVIQGAAEKTFFDSPDLVVANIHFEVMKYLINSPLFPAKTHFIFSGLLRSQVKPVMDILGKRQARIIRKWHRENIWYTLYGKVG